MLRTFIFLVFLLLFLIINGALTTTTAAIDRKSESANGKRALGSNPIPVTQSVGSTSAITVKHSNTTTTAAPSKPPTPTKKVVPPNVTPPTSQHPKNQTSTSPTSMIQSKDKNINATVIIPTTPKFLNDTIHQNATLLIEKLNDASKLWDFINLKIVLTKNGTNSLDETIKNTTKTFHEIFSLGKNISKWLMAQSKSKKLDPLFIDIATASSNLVEKIETMNREMNDGIEAIGDADKVFVKGSLTVSKYINQTTKYLKGYFREKYAKNLTEVCLNEDYTQLIDDENLNITKYQHLIEGLNADPLNDERISKIANIVVNAVKELIMIDAACDILTKNESLETMFSDFINNGTKQAIDDSLDMIYEKYTQCKVDFQNAVTEILNKRLKEKEKTNSEISNNIYNDLALTFNNYEFAVAVFDQNKFITDKQRVYSVGNVFISNSSANGKTAFAIANQKPTSDKKSYYKCEFWKLNEMEVCSKATGKNFYKIIDIIQQKCNWITDIAVIKMIPHSLNGYVSPNFHSKAFCVSGLGLGDCFHYSIFVANKFA